MTTNARYFETKEQYLAFREKWAHAPYATAAHHMLYNIIRGRDPEHGFTPFQRLSKMKGQGYINRGSYGAWYTLRQYQTRAKRDSLSEFGQGQLNRFLAPFGGTFTQEDLANIEIPKVEPIYPTYGPGRKIVRQIEAGEIAAPKTCLELKALCNQPEEEAQPKPVEVKVEPPKKPTWQDAIKRALGRGVKLIDRGAA